MRQGKRLFAVTRQPAAVQRTKITTVPTLISGRAETPANGAVGVLWAGVFPLSGTLQDIRFYVDGKDDETAQVTVAVADPSGDSGFKTSVKVKNGDAKSDWAIPVVSGARAEVTCEFSEGISSVWFGAMYYVTPLTTIGESTNGTESKVV